MTNLTTHPLKNEGNGPSGENHKIAAKHLEEAAKNHHEAAKHHESGDHEAAGKCAVKASEHIGKAIEAQKVDATDHAVKA